MHGSNFYESDVKFSDLTERETYFKTFDYRTSDGYKCKDNRVMNVTSKLLEWPSSMEYLDKDNPCDYHGESYLWCWTQSSWDKCSVKPG